MASDQVHDLNGTKSDTETWDDLRLHSRFKPHVKRQRQKAACILLIIAAVGGCFMNTDERMDERMDGKIDKNRSAGFSVSGDNIVLAHGKKQQDTKTATSCFSKKLNECGIVGGIIRLTDSDCLGE